MPKEAPPEPHHNSSQSNPSPTDQAVPVYRLPNAAHTSKPALALFLQRCLLRFLHNTFPPRFRSRRVDHARFPAYAPAIAALAFLALPIHNAIPARPATIIAILLAFLLLSFAGLSVARTAAMHAPAGILIRQGLLHTRIRYIRSNALHSVSLTSTLSLWRFLGYRSVTIRWGKPVPFRSKLTILTTAERARRFTMYRPPSRPS